MKILKYVTNNLTGAPSSVVWKAECGVFLVPNGDSYEGKSYITTWDGITFECFFFQEEVGFHEDVQFECRFHRQSPSKILVDLGDLDGAASNPWVAFMKAWTQCSDLNGGVEALNDRFESMHYLNTRRKTTWQMTA